VATSYLAAARQLQALTNTHTAAPHHHQRQQQQQQGAASGRDSSNDSGSNSGGSNGGSSLEALEFAVSLTQHHDAVTGTEKQAVANDYAR